MDPVTNYLQAWSLISEAIGLNNNEEDECNGKNDESGN